jgi:hypothetical protein
MIGRRIGGEGVGQAPGGADLPGATPKPMDDAAASLAREVYWAGDGVSGVPADSRSLRERLDAFAHQMRVEQGEVVPVGETFLGSAAAWKRGVKQFVWRLTRFSTMRYDRLLADLAEMNAELARRLLETDEEVARLRRELHQRDGERP